MKQAPEHNLQVAIIKHLRINHIYCFAIPNGGRRDAITGAMLKKEGVLAGVADIEILLPNGKAVFVELKNGTAGRQSLEQKSFENEVKLRGFEYRIWRTFKDCEEFVKGDNVQTTGTGGSPLTPTSPSLKAKENE